MTRTVVAATVVGLLSVFFVIALSVVDARRPLDGRVSTSFEAVISKRISRASEAIPLGCYKQQPYFYGCSAAHPLRRRSTAVVQWRLLLRDDGCWSASPMAPFASPEGVAVLRPRLRHLNGCIRG
jgi:hypothetical protein